MENNKMMAGGTPAGLIPVGLVEIEKVAKILFDSGAVGPDCKSAIHVVAKIITGMEMGMMPMEAVQSLYIVNGKVSIYGVAMTKRLKEHGYEIEVVKHSVQECHLRIMKGSKKYEMKYTLAEMVAALPPKSQAKDIAPLDKIFWFTIARFIRYHAAEVLGSSGVAYIYEEIADQEEPPTVKEVEKDSNGRATLPGQVTIDVAINEAAGPDRVALGGELQY